MTDSLQDYTVYEGFAKVCDCLERIERAMTKVQKPPVVLLVLPTDMPIDPSAIDRLGEMISERLGGSVAYTPNRVEEDGENA